MNCCVDCKFYFQDGKLCTDRLITKHTWDYYSCSHFEERTKWTPKTCNTCKHWGKALDYDVMMCHNPANIVTSGFRVSFQAHGHCSIWEPKQEKENDNMAKVPETPEIPDSIQKIVDSAGAVSELCGITYKQLMAQGFTAQQAMELTKHILTVSINHK